MSTGIQEVKEWILDRNAGMTDIDPHLDIIENRLIDSLSFVEFVFLISQLSGVAIQIDALTLDDFRSLHSIEKRYF